MLMFNVIVDSNLFFVMLKWFWLMVLDKIILFVWNKFDW